MTGEARDQRGAVTLEAALVAPVVALLVAGVLGATTVLTDQLAVERAARALARAVAVTGTSAGAATALPPGAIVRTVRRPTDVTVEVVLRGEVVGVPYSVSATATSTIEPAVGAPSGSLPSRDGTGRL